MRELLASLLLRLPEHPRRQAYQMLSVGLMALGKLLCPSRCRCLRIAVFEHRLSGNLRAFCARVRQDGLEAELGFMPTDPAVFRTLRENPEQLPHGVRLLDRLSLADMAWTIGAHVFLTSMMARRFVRLIKRLHPGTNFVQTFHSYVVLPEPRSWFTAMADFDHLFAPSEWFAENLLARHGVPRDRIHVTGYAALDEFVQETRSREELCQLHQLDPSRPIVLYAPTLQAASDEAGGAALKLSDPLFLQQLDQWAGEHHAQIVLRTHPLEKINVDSLPNLFLRPASKYREVFAQLRVADVMVSDLSGIMVYYAALQRPQVVIRTMASQAADGVQFIEEVDLPGDVVDRPSQLFASLDRALADPVAYCATHGQKMSQLRERAFGNTLDGQCASRYFECLARLNAREDKC
ncbi:hypothetical protein DYH09_16660 [bacterium CPR1]|nr:hypothetical protein [bacterium CPR1]